MRQFHTTEPETTAGAGAVRESRTALLELRLFGGFTIRPVSGASFPPSLRSRARALLALLLLRHPHPTPRLVLERAFVAQYEEPRDALRRALWELGEAFRALEPDRPDRRLTSVGDCVQLELAGIWCDLHEFDRAADTEDAVEWQRAVDLYSQDLLAVDDLGLTSVDWVRRARSQRRDRAVAMLERLTAHYLASGSLACTEDCLERLHALEPLRGDILLQLLDVVCRQAKYSKANRIHLDSASDLLDRQSSQAALTMLTDIKGTLLGNMAFRQAPSALEGGSAYAPDGNPAARAVRLRSLRPDWARARAQQYRLKQATERDRKWIMMQKALAYPEELFLPAGRAKQWYDRYPSGMTIIKKTGRRIGHVNLLALSSAAFDQFVAGSIGEEGIRPGDLLSDRALIRNVYLESLVTGAGYPSAVGAMLLNLESIVRRMCEPDQLERIYTQPVSEASRRLVLDLGFELVSAAETRTDRQDLWSVQYTRLQQFVTSFYASDEP
jgi:DNA-binding SARP family transcriptional activator